MSARPLVAAALGLMAPLLLGAQLTSDDCNLYGTWDGGFLVGCEGWCADGTCRMIAYSISGGTASSCFCDGVATDADCAGALVHRAGEPPFILCTPNACPLEECPQAPLASVEQACLCL